jgi:hypothetical protein
MSSLPCSLSIPPSHLLQGDVILRLLPLHDHVHTLPHHLLRHIDFLSPSLCVFASVDRDPVSSPPSISPSPSCEDDEDFDTSFMFFPQMLTLPVDLMSLFLDDSFPSSLDRVDDYAIVNN